MPVLPDWPASPPIVRCGRTSISTVTLLVGGDTPWLTPTETPGAIYLPALNAVLPAVLPALPLAAALGLSVPVVGLVGLEPNLNQSKPRLPRSLSSTPGPPPASVEAAAASCNPSPALS